jgi:alcohol dehydrogenase class IV
MALCKFVAPEIVFGNGARALVGRYARNLGAVRVLLVTDAGVLAAGWPAQAADALEAESIKTIIFSGVSENPRAGEIMRGAELYAAEGCDVVVAIGGGSALDCAKGIGIVAAHGRDILEFEGIDRVSQPSPPLICVPTTAGSSADVSQFVIVADPEARVKKAIISKAVVPDVALVDPETTVTMTAFQTACSGFDALCHGFEAFVSTAHSPIVDLHALDAVATVREHLVDAIRRPDDLETRGAMMLAALKAGLAFSNTSLGAAHAMAHAVGGLLDMAHGECVAMILPHVAARNYDWAPERYDALAGALGVPVDGATAAERRDGIVRALSELATAIGLDGGLGRRGVKAEDLPGLAQLAAHDPCIVTNPRRLSAGDLETIYGQAL